MSICNAKEKTLNRFTANISEWPDNRCTRRVDLSKVLLMVMKVLLNLLKVLAKRLKKRFVIFLNGPKDV